MVCRQPACAGFLSSRWLPCFFATNGHRVVVANLLRTTVDVPIGAFELTSDGARMMLGFLARSFELGVYSAFPLLVSAGVGLVATGLLHRLVPQLASMVSSARDRVRRADLYAAIRVRSHQWDVRDGNHSLLGAVCP